MQSGIDWVCVGLQDADQVSIYTGGFDGTEIRKLDLSIQ